LGHWEKSLGGVMCVIGKRRIIRKSSPNSTRTKDVKSFKGGSLERKKCEKNKRKSNNGSTGKGSRKGKEWFRDR